MGHAARNMPESCINNNRDSCFRSSSDNNNNNNNFGTAGFGFANAYPSNAPGSRCI